MVEGLVDPMLAVICHDAGGAQLVASYIARSGRECKFVLEGPAIKIFKERLGDVEIVSLDEALTQCDEFICGTSWQSDLEWRAIGQAKTLKKPVCVILDHWVNYSERFVRNSIKNLPDKIWVCDKPAEQIAINHFPSVPIEIIPNPYFQDLKEEIENIKKLRNVANTEKIKVLFVCEPLSEHAEKEFNNPLYWGYTEFDALKFFFKNLPVLKKEVEQIKIRPHPAEKPGKYSDIINEFSDVTVLGGDKTLLEELSEADIVVGCETMAMVVGLEVGLRVISAIPPTGAPCALPHPEIESLTDLINKN